ncbi:hypothetical protein [Brumimicrobium mesophilum]|uniref:hypothetical protein n=1 Tax=Brumimicrobium mesophilum TaxID=392717 RepID=UPI000D141EBD|nr:hypothetical protein [Brumimicrobium mesophilum]
MEKPTQEEINALKAKHGALHMLEVEDKWAILKAPDRKTLSAASAIAAKDPMKFNEIILKNCMVAGDEEIQKDDAYFLAASSKIPEIIEIKEAKLEKL